MLEDWAAKREGRESSTDGNKLSQQAWGAPVIADGEAADSSTVKDTTKDAKEQNPGKPVDALVQHLPINDRCSLDIYEHHWELTMPRITKPVISSGVKVNEKMQLEIVEQRGEETLIQDKLIMNDKGEWTMKDEDGDQVQPIRWKGGSYSKETPQSLDPTHPEKKTMLRERIFSNDAHVFLKPTGDFILVRQNDHDYKSKQGTPEYDYERLSNRLVVEFDKLHVKSVLDRDKQYTIELNDDAQKSP